MSCIETALCIHFSKAELDIILYHKIRLVLRTFLSFFEILSSYAIYFFHIRCIIQAPFQSQEPVIQWPYFSLTYKYLYRCVKDTLVDLTCFLHFGLFVVFLTHSNFPFSIISCLFFLILFLYINHSVRLHI